MSWIMENIIALISDWIGGGLEYFGESINNIYVQTIEWTIQNVYYQNAQKFIIFTALGLIGLSVLVIVFTGYVMETDYDSEADPFNLIVKIAQVSAVILNTGWIFNWFLQLSRDFTTDLIGHANADGYHAITRSLLQVDLKALGLSIGWHMLFLLVVFVAEIVFNAVAALRAIELVGMNLLFPFFALDMLTNSKERWNMFFPSYLINFFSYGLQVLFFMLAMKSYASATTGYSTYTFSTIGFLIAAIALPQFLDKYTYKSGVGRAVSGGMRVVAQSVLMRSTMRV